MRNEEALNKFVAIVIDEQIYIISGSVARPMCSLILNGTTLESQTTDKNELTIENIIALVERDYINVGYEGKLTNLVRVIPIEFGPGNPCILLMQCCFPPGETCQLDWSEEFVETKSLSQDMYADAQTVFGSAGIIS